MGMEILSIISENKGTAPYDTINKHRFSKCLVSQGVLNNTKGLMKEYKEKERECLKGEFELNCPSSPGCHAQCTSI